MSAQRSMVVTVGANVAPYVAGMNTAGAATGRFATSTAGATAGAARMGRGLGLLSPKILGPAGLVLALKSAVGSANEFNESTIRLRTQIGLTTGQSEALASAARQVGVAYGAGGQAAIDASWQIASAGLRGAAATETLQLSAQAAALGFGDMTTVADLVTSAINAYGKENLSATQATNILAYAVREGKAAPEELAASMGQVLPIASEMGVEFAELASIVAAMTRTGTNAATANIQMRQVLMNLLKPSQQAAEALSDVGLSAADIRRVIEDEGLFPALMMLRDAFAGNEQGMAAVFENARSLMGALDLMGANFEENEKIVNGFSDELDLVGRGMKELEATSTSFAWNRLKANFTDLALTVGGPLNSELRNTLNLLNDIMFSGRPGPGVSGSDLSPDDFRGTTTGVGGFVRNLFGMNMRQAGEELFVTMGLMDQFETDTGLRYLSRLVELSDAGDLLARSVLFNLNNELGENSWAVAEAADAARDGMHRNDEYRDAFLRLPPAIDESTDSHDAATAAVRNHGAALRASSDPLARFVQAQQRFDEVSNDANATIWDQFDALSELLAATDALAAEGFDGKLDPALRAAMVTLGLTEIEVRELELALKEGMTVAEWLQEKYELELDTAEAAVKLREIEEETERWINTEKRGVVTLDTSDAQRRIRALQSQMAAIGIMDLEFMSPQETGAKPRASGGTVSRNSPYIVGERGPEMFVPASSGTIVAAPQTANAMAGGDSARINLTMPVTQSTMDEGEIRRAIRRAELEAA